MKVVYNQTGSAGPAAGKFSRWAATFPNRDSISVGKSLKFNLEFDNVLQMGYVCGMKIKTSVTLSDELVEAIDQYSDPYKNRSDFIEAATWAFIKQIIRDQQNARDIEIINRNADRLNAEALDVLAYQVQL